MKRNLQLALAHIKDNLGSVVIMMGELFVVLYLAASVVSSSLGIIRTQQLYEQLGLERIAEVFESNIPSLPDSVKVVNDKKKSGMSSYTYKGKYFDIDCVSAEYFSYFQYPMRKGTIPDPQNTSIVQGVFTDALKEQFEVGKVYTLESFEGSFDVLMVGQLKGNYIYQSHNVTSAGNHIFLYDGGNLIPNPIENYTVTVFVEDEDALTEEQKALLMWTKDTVSWAIVFGRRFQGQDLVIGILLLVLGFATFAGYNFMQMLQKEKTYGVYYLCGASWRDCLQIQLMENFITLGIPLLLVVVRLYYYDLVMPPTGTSDYNLSWESFCIMIGVCALTFLLTSLEGILQLKKKSPVTIIERWNQT